MVLRHTYVLTGSSHDIVYMLLIPPLIFVYVLRLPYIVN